MANYYNIIISLLRTPSSRFNPPTSLFYSTNIIQSFDDLSILDLLYYFEVVQVYEFSCVCLISIF